MTNNVKLILDSERNLNPNSLKNKMKTVVNLLKEVSLSKKLTKMWNIDDEIDHKERMRMKLIISVKFGDQNNTFT